MTMQDYAPYMRAAIRLANESRFKTYPNPAVGAVLVKDGKIVAKGRHKAAGLPHAEIECLEDAKIRGIDPKNSTMVVTLEPCAHYGKTPPCADALISAGIDCLVYGAKDPNPEASGGAAKLAAAGVNVLGPVLEQECLDLIADFIVWQNSNKPYVILKLAASLDGRIATRSGQSRWISGEEARREVHELRRDLGKAGGAVLIGGATFRADNPQLTARLPDMTDAPQPLACIFTSRLPRADGDYELLKKRPDQCVFFSPPAASASVTAEALRKLGCRVLSVNLSPNNGEPDFATMLTEIRQNFSCPYVFCEGGGKLGLSLLEANLVDEFHLFLAPIILGDNDARPLFNGRSPINLDEALRMRLCSLGKVGSDAKLLLRRSKQENGA